ncbi:glycosyltransferase family 2 protein [Flavobacterium sp.]|uniref:glycosyltransferase family 2 protein n=1 Tax=Flavobacterium sp. TaxID=239 RepID=UPI003753A114
MKIEKTPILSVCVITYGHEYFIEKSLQSILMQECDFEYNIIVCNDNSPDNTEDKVQSILKNHPKSSLIKYHNHEKNIGAMPNFLFALQKCNGKYIAICEGDDYWIDKNKIQNQVSFLENNKDYSLCFTSRNVIDENEKVISKEIYEFKDWTTLDIINGIIPPTQTIISKNLSNEFIDFYTKHLGSFGADKLYSYFYSQKGKIKSLPDITSVYRNNGFGIWTKHNAYKKIILHIDESLKFYKIIACNKREFTLYKSMLFRRVFIKLNFEFIKYPARTLKLYVKIVVKYKPSLNSMLKASYDFFNYYFNLVLKKS